MENMLKIEKVNEIIQKSEEIEALREIKKRLLDIFDIEELKLFGSVARVESDEESDIDLFILTKKHLSRIERHKITDVVFSINLHYGTNFSTTVIDVGSWEKGPVSALSLHDEIIKNGISL